MIVSDEIYMDEAEHVYWESASGLRVVGVSELLRHSGYAAEFFGNAAVEDAMRRGRNVHLALHYQHRGILDPKSLSPRIRPYYDCAMDFHRLIGGVCQLTESIVFDPLARLAATLDTLWEIDGIPTVIDYKTGAISEGTRYQLAAQANGLQPNGLQPNGLQPNGLSPGKYRRWALQLFDDGRPASLTKFENDRDLNVVRMMASLFYTKVNDGVLKWGQTKSAISNAQRRHDEQEQLFLVG